MYDQIAAQIKAVNSGSAPLIVEVTGNQMVVSLNLADATFFTFIQANKVQKVFKVVITFDPQSHIATVENQDYSFEQSGGIGGYGAQMQSFKGESYSMSFATEAGIKTDGTVGIAYSYFLNSIKLNKDIKQILQSNGWKLGRSKTATGAIVFAALAVFVVVVIVVLLMLHVIG